MGCFYFFGCVRALQNQPSNESSRLRIATREQPSSILTLFSRREIFQHDNAPIYTAKQTSKFFEQAQISIMEWPPQSPDINPIKHLWDAIDRTTRLRMAESTSGTNLESLYCCLQVFPLIRYLTYYRLSLCLIELTQLFKQWVDTLHINQHLLLQSNRDFGLRSFQLLLGKSVWIQERSKTQSGEESSSSGRFNPVGRLQQSGCLGSYPP